MCFYSSGHSAGHSVALHCTYIEACSFCTKVYHLKKYSYEFDYLSHPLFYMGVEEYFAVLINGHVESK